jgi:hypothetical protein
MREYNVTYKDIADRLGLSGIKVRQLINSDPLTFVEMCTLADVLNEAGTCRIVFIIPRP